MNKIVAEIFFIVMWLLNTIQIYLTDDNIEKLIYSLMALLCLIAYWILAKLREIHTTLEKANTD